MSRRTVATTAVAVTALGGAFLLGTAVTDDDPGTPRGDEQRSLAAGTPLGASDVALVAAGSCDDLLGWYVENTRDLVTAYGWNDPSVYYDHGGLRQRDGWTGGPAFAEDGAFVDLQNGRAPMASADRVTGSYAELSKSPLDGQGNSETGTNVQEVGVDETDVVKTDGESLFRLVEDDLVVYDVTGKQPERLATFDLPGKQQGQPEMLLVDDRVVVFSAAWDGDRATTTALTVSVTDPAEPEVVSTTTYDAELLSARQYGGTVRLALSRGLPALDFVMPDEDRSEREAREENRKLVEESTISDWLPTASDDGGDPGLAVECGDMARPDDFDGGGNLVVLGYDAAEPAERSAAGVASSAMTLYSSTDRLYLASQAANPVCCWGGDVIIAPDSMIEPRRIAPPVEQDGTTTLHAFSLEGSSATYLASGEVEGAVRDRWAMDAVGGTLRVAVSPTSETGDFNSVITLGEEDGALVELGRVDRIGVGEEIKSVRWFDDVAFVVTFRQVDPLYALDLSDVEHPKLAGELKIPGFSEYLHPIGGDLLLGIGVPGSQWGEGPGVQASVFDISDLAHPKRVDTVRYRPNKHSDVGVDPRQFTWVPELRTAIHVVGRYGHSGGMTGFLGVLSVDERGGIEKDVRFGTHGYDDVAALRTVPLPDDRVVVVTEDEARFLDLTP